MQAECREHWANAAAPQAPHKVMVKAEAWWDIPAKYDVGATAHDVSVLGRPWLSRDTPSLPVNEQGNRRFRHCSGF